MGLSKLSQEEIEKNLKELPGWTIVQEKLHKEFIFEDFSQAFDFMTRAVSHIDQMNFQLQPIASDTQCFLVLFRE